MIRSYPRQRRCSVAIALVMIATAAWIPSPCPADDEVVADDGQPQNDQQANVIDLASNFDANLFDRHGNGFVIRGGVGNAGFVRIQVNGVMVAASEPRPNASPSLTKARATGSKRLERIESACGLSTDQRAKLQLAIESDAHRFAAEIDAVRAKYATRKVNLNHPAGQKEWQTFQQEIQRCREKMRGLYGSSSLFATVLGSALDERQLTCLREEQAARRLYHWRALVAESLARLDDTLALSEKQHAAIETMLLARVPPLRIDGDIPAINDGNLRRQLVFMALSELDAKKLRGAVSERQWTTLGNLTAHGRAMRSWIETQGVLETGEQ